VISNSTINDQYGGSGLGNGVHTKWGMTTVSHSVIRGNSQVGLFAHGLGTINADNNVVSDNFWGALAGDGGANQANATLRLSNNIIYNNKTGIGCGGGIIASNGSNKVAGNSGGAAACAPNTVLVQQ
jgi:hypothetical protein